MTDNKDIKIPATHYVGFQRSSGNELPLAFMTPDGTDAAATSRKTTVDNWASGYGSSAGKQIPSKSIDNKPMSGFKLLDEIKRGYGWGKGNVVWRIEDPRGFQLEISSPNLASIIGCTTIENGEILEKCVWGRLRADNVLIPVSSDVYKAAVSNTERLNKSASVRDAKPGDEVIMQAGEEGVYLGSFYTLDKDYHGSGYNNEENVCVNISAKKRHILGIKNETGEWQKFRIYSTFKISEIKAGIELSIGDAEKLINEQLTSGVGSEGIGYRSIIAVTAKPIPVANLILKVRDATYSELNALASIKHCTYTSNIRKLFAKLNGQWLLIDGYYAIKGNHHGHPISGYVVDEQAMLDGKIKKLERSRSQQRYYGFYGSNYKEFQAVGFDQTQLPGLEYKVLYAEFTTTHGHAVTPYF